MPLQSGQRTQTQGPFQHLKVIVHHLKVVIHQVVRPKAIVHLLEVVVVEIVVVVVVVAQVEDHHLPAQKVAVEEDNNTIFS